VFGFVNLVIGIMNGAEIIIKVVVIAALSSRAKKIPEVARSFDKEAKRDAINKKPKME
jgi:hypothetical protein